MNKYLKYIITAILFIAAAVSFVLFEILKISIVNDVVTNILLTRAIYHTIIVLLIVWIICMLIAASFGMKEDLKDKKNDSSYNLKAAKNFLIGGIVFIVAGIIMLFFTK